MTRLNLYALRHWGGLAKGGTTIWFSNATNQISPLFRIFTFDITISWTSQRVGSRLLSDTVLTIAGNAYF
jgi:hypothetical protein